MFIQNRAKSIAQRLNAKNIAPLRERIAKFADKIKFKKPFKSFCYFWLLPKVESLPLPLKPNLPNNADSANVRIKIDDVICVDFVDSANQNNSSLRNFAKQSCGNPQGFARAVARSNHPLYENNIESQGGLPRSHSLARNDNFLLDSAESQNLGKNNPRVSANLLKASSGVGEGVVREGEGSDFAIQAPAPSLKKNARGEKGESKADLSAHRRKEIDYTNSQNLQGGWLLRNARKSFGLPRRFCESARNDEFLDSSLRKCSAQNDNTRKIAESRLDSANNIFSELKSLLQDLKPWRKGPFNFCGIEVQSEWDSAIKFNIIAPHLSVGGKVVADIGCNNGYYAFRLLPLFPKKIIGFEPSAHCKMQFDLINAFVKSEICFEMLGVEDLADYDCKFDCILCLGVLYHRTNPLDCLKILKNALNPNGELIIDTLIIEGEDEIVLSPLSYAKMKNVYFVPSVRAFQNWLKRAGFKEIELLEIRKTTSIEQRKTAWSGGESLEDFLDKNDKNKTIEGYNAPTRAYFKAKI